MFSNEESSHYRHQAVMEMPIYKKGKEILSVVQQITDLIPDTDENLGYIRAIILEDAMLLNAKLISAEGGDLYDIRMENAAIIRKAANNLKIQYHNLEMFDFEHVDYYQMVRELIEEYRILFIEWVNSFDKSNYVVDRWGLFNPPGVSPFDQHNELF